MFAPLMGNQRIGSIIRCDGPMRTRAARNDVITVPKYITDVLKSEDELLHGANEAEPIHVPETERTEAVCELMEQNSNLLNILGEKRGHIEALKNLDLNQLMAKTKRASNMDIVSHVSDALNLGVRRITQVIFKS